MHYSWVRKLSRRTFKAYKLLCNDVHEDGSPREDVQPLRVDLATRILAPWVHPDLLDVAVDQLLVMKFAISSTELLSWIVGLHADVYDGGERHHDTHHTEQRRSGEGTTSRV